MNFLIRLLAFLIVAPLVSGDVVYLKSGRKIVCEKAWEDGKEVKYIIAEGTVGIPRAIVAKIEKSPPPDPDDATPQTIPSESTQSQPAEIQTPVAKHARVQSYTARAKSLIDKKDYAGALDYLKKAYELEKTKETTYNLAITYYMLKDDWNASLLLHELLRLDPKNTEALNYLADQAWRKENLGEAKSYWERSLAIKEDPRVRARLDRLKKEKKASDSYADSNTRHFLMKYDGGIADPGLVDEIHLYLEESYRQLSIQFEEYPGEPFVVVLYPQEDYLSITEAPFWSGGFNDGKIKLPVGGATALNDELRSVLIHELTHSFITSKSSGKCPAWLQEGLAQRMEGKVPSDEAMEGLRNMASKNALPSVKHLGGSFIESRSNQAAVMYLLSLSFTNFLADRYGFFYINSLLDSLATGHTMEQSFQNSYGVPIADLHEKWRLSLE